MKRHGYLVAIGSPVALILLAALGCQPALPTNSLPTSQTEFVFSGIQENVSIEDARFRFQTPAGVEMVESTSVTP